MNKIKILVVDDEPTICNMVLRFLSMNNYEGDSANNGKEALKMLEERDYQIVLTDIKMPEMDGIALMRAAKTNSPDLVFVIMSGYGTLESAIDTMKMGALNFIKKPISIVELITTIKKAEDVIVHKNLPLKMQSYIDEIHKTLTLTSRDLNDDLDMIVHYLISDVSNFGIDKSRLDNLTLAIYEALNNAVEHGNLELSKDFDRNANMDAFETFLRSKVKKLEIPEFAKKKVKIEIVYRDGKLSFIITDDGKGFDHANFMGVVQERIYADKINRGLFLIRNVVDEMAFNPEGNQIRLTVDINKKE